MAFTDTLQHAWNAFLSREPTKTYQDLGYSSSYRPDRMRFTRGNERSIVTGVYNRIALDVALVNIEHVRLDENGRFKEAIKSKLQNALSLDANIDQTGRGFIMDLVMSMFDEGVIAVVPTETTYNPIKSDSYDIKSMRVAKITEWFPKHVKVNVYNELTGRKEDLILPKKMVSIIENPLYSIMNEPNSTLQRLIRTLNQLDLVNGQTTSGKLDLIIQLPYVIKSDARKVQAEARRAEIERQLTGSKYGIAYTDGTEKITQLNRSIDNQLWQQAKDLTEMLYNQLGLSPTIFDGTADEKTMLNYYNRTIDPILLAITEEMERKFLTATARTQGQAIRYFRDPFRLVPISQIADIADKFTRNEIATSNEIRAEIGWKPFDSPEADELRNKNLNKIDNPMEGAPDEEDMEEEYEPGPDEEIEDDQEFEDDSEADDSETDDSETDDERYDKFLEQVRKILGG